MEGMQQARRFPEAEEETVRGFRRRFVEGAL
jgi:hypothetical protein